MMDSSNESPQSAGNEQLSGFSILETLDPILPLLPPLGSRWVSFSLCLLTKQLQSGMVTDIDAFGDIFQFWNFGGLSQTADLDWLLWNLIDGTGCDASNSADGQPEPLLQTEPGHVVSADGVERSRRRGRSKPDAFWSASAPDALDELTRQSVRFEQHSEQSTASTQSDLSENSVQFSGIQPIDVQSFDDAVEQTELGEPSHLENLSSPSAAVEEDFSASSSGAPDLEQAGQARQAFVADISAQSPYESSASFAESAPQDLSENDFSDQFETAEPRSSEVSTPTPESFNLQDADLSESLEQTVDTVQAEQQTETEVQLERFQSEDALAASRDSDGLLNQTDLSSADLSVTATNLVPHISAEQVSEADRNRLPTAVAGSDQSDSAQALAESFSPETSPELLLHDPRIDTAIQQIEPEVQPQQPESVGRSEGSSVKGDYSGASSHRADSFDSEPVSAFLPIESENESNIGQTVKAGLDSDSTPAGQTEVSGPEASKIEDYSKQPEQDFRADTKIQQADSEIQLASSVQNPRTDTKIQQSDSDTLTKQAQQDLQIYNKIQTDLPKQNSQTDAGILPTQNKTASEIWTENRDSKELPGPELDSPTGAGIADSDRTYPAVNIGSGIAQAVTSALDESRPDQLKPDLQEQTEDQLDNVDWSQLPKQNPQTETRIQANQPMQIAEAAVEKQPEQSRQATNSVEPNYLNDLLEEGNTSASELGQPSFAISESEDNADRDRTNPIEESAWKPDAVQESSGSGKDTDSRRPPQLYPKGRDAKVAATEILPPEPDISFASQDPAASKGSESGVRSWIGQGLSWLKSKLEGEQTQEDSSQKQQSQSSSAALKQNQVSDAHSSTRFGAGKTGEAVVEGIENEDIKSISPAQRLKNDLLHNGRVKSEASKFAVRDSEFPTSFEDSLENFSKSSETFSETPLVKKPSQPEADVTELIVTDEPPRFSDPQPTEIIHEDTERFDADNSSNPRNIDRDKTTSLNPFEETPKQSQGQWFSQSQNVGSDQSSTGLDSPEQNPTSANRGSTDSREHSPSLDDRNPAAQALDPNRPHIESVQPLVQSSEVTLLQTQQDEAPEAIEPSEDLVEPTAFVEDSKTKLKEAAVDEGLEQNPSSSSASKVDLPLSREAEPTAASSKPVELSSNPLNSTGSDPSHTPRDEDQDLSSSSSIHSRSSSPCLEQVSGVVLSDSDTDPNSLVLDTNGTELRKQRNQEQNAQHQPLSESVQNYQSTETHTVDSTLSPTSLAEPTGESASAIRERSVQDQNKASAQDDSLSISPNTQLQSNSDPESASKPELSQSPESAFNSGLERSTPDADSPQPLESNAYNLSSPSEIAHEQNQPNLSGQFEDQNPLQTPLQTNDDNAPDVLDSANSAKQAGYEAVTPVVTSHNVAQRLNSTEDLSNSEEYTAAERMAFDTLTANSQASQPAAEESSDPVESPAHPATESIPPADRASETTPITAVSSESVETNNLSDHSRRSPALEALQFAAINLEGPVSEPPSTTAPEAAVLGVDKAQNHPHLEDIEETDPSDNSVQQQSVDPNAGQADLDLLQQTSSDNSVKDFSTAESVLSQPQRVKQLESGSDSEHSAIPTAEKAEQPERPIAQQAQNPVQDFSSVVPDVQSENATKKVSVSASPEDIASASNVDVSVIEFSTANETAEEPSHAAVSESTNETLEDINDPVDFNKSSIKDRAQRLTEQAEDIIDKPISQMATAVPVFYPEVASSSGPEPIQEQTATSVDGPAETPNIVTETLAKDSEQKIEPNIEAQHGKSPSSAEPQSESISALASSAYTVVDQQDFDTPEAFDPEASEGIAFQSRASKVLPVQEETTVPAPNALNSLHDAAVAPDTFSGTESELDYSAESEGDSHFPNQFLTEKTESANVSSKRLEENADDFHQVSDTFQLGIEENISRGDQAEAETPDTLTSTESETDSIRDPGSSDPAELNHTSQASGQNAEPNPDAFEMKLPLTEQPLAKAVELAIESPKSIDDQGQLSNSATAGHLSPDLDIDVDRSELQDRNSSTQLQPSSDSEPPFTSILIEPSASEAIPVQNHSIPNAELSQSIESKTSSLSQAETLDSADGAEQTSHTEQNPQILSQAEPDQNKQVEERTTAEKAPSDISISDLQAPQQVLEAKIDRADPTANSPAKNTQPPDKVAESPLAETVTREAEHLNRDPDPNSAPETSSEAVFSPDTLSQSTPSQQPQVSGVTQPDQNVLDRSVLLEQGQERLEDPTPSFPEQSSTIPEIGLSGAQAFISAEVGSSPEESVVQSIQPQELDQQSDSKDSSSKANQEFFVSQPTTESATQPELQNNTQKNSAQTEDESKSSHNLDQTSAQKKSFSSESDPSDIHNAPNLETDLFQNAEALRIEALYAAEKPHVESIEVEAQQKAVHVTQPILENESDSGTAFTDAALEAETREEDLSPSAANSAIDQEVFSSSVEQSPDRFSDRTISSPINKSVASRSETEVNPTEDPWSETQEPLESASTAPVMQHETGSAREEEESQDYLKQEFPESVAVESPIDTHSQRPDLPGTSDEESQFFSENLVADSSSEQSHTSTALPNIEAEAASQTQFPVTNNSEGRALDLSQQNDTKFSSAPSQETSGPADISEVSTLTEWPIAATPLIQQSSLLSHLPIASELLEESENPAANTVPDSTAARSGPGPMTTSANSLQYPSAWSSLEDLIGSFSSPFESQAGEDHPAQDNEPGGSGDNSWDSLSELIHSFTPEGRSPLPNPQEVEPDIISETITSTMPFNVDESNSKPRLSHEEFIQLILEQIQLKTDLDFQFFSSAKKVMHNQEYFGNSGSLLSLEQSALVEEAYEKACSEYSSEYDSERFRSIVSEVVEFISSERHPRGDFLFNNFRKPVF